MPDYLYLVVVPVVSLLLAVFLAHTLIGPFGRMIGDGVAWAVKWVMTGSFARSARHCLASCMHRW
ncbi:EIIBC-Tre [Serratia fonticola]|uniref:EIIBC-Tre n=1 Tax=Serratia fonticola TaxID=47917 RepID=A0A4U9TLA1_SERFO|nr:EIIBC-Tre [Serratia fonticola]